MCPLAYNAHVYLRMNTTQNNSGELISVTVSLGASRSSWWSCDTWSANIWGRAKACHSMSITKNSGVVVRLVFFFSFCSKHPVLNILCSIFFNQIWVNVLQELWLANQPVSDYSEKVIISQEKITSKICLFQSCTDVYLSLENFQSMNELEKLRMLLKKVHTVLSLSLS